MKITLSLADTVITITFLDETRQVAEFYEILYQKFLVDTYQPGANLTVRFLPCASAQLPTCGGEENPHYEMVIAKDQVAMWWDTQPKGEDDFPMGERSIAIRLLNTMLLFSPEKRIGRLYVTKEDQPFRALYHFFWIFCAEIFRTGCSYNDIQEHDHEMV